MDSAMGRRRIKKVSLSTVKDDFSRYLRLAQSEEIVITRHGQAAGVLIGFDSEDDWFEYRLEADPRFLSHMERARKNVRSGKAVRLAEVKRSGRRRR